MKRLLVNLTDEELAKLDKLLKKKIHSSRSEAFREAIELLLEAEKYPELRHIVEKLRKRGLVRAEFRLSKREIKNKIIVFLRKHPFGATINEISETIGLHRHTVRKYLADLSRFKVIFQKKIGTSKISYLSKRLSK